MRVRLILRLLLHQWGIGSIVLDAIFCFYSSMLTYCLVSYPAYRGWRSLAEVFSIPSSWFVALFSIGVGLICTVSYNRMRRATEKAWRAEDHVSDLWLLAMISILAKTVTPSKLVYNPPGSRLLSFSEFFFSPKTHKEIFEPTIRDLFEEYCQALNARREWKARWVCIRGYWSFWSAVFAHLPISAVKMIYKIWQATR
jgi:hypothetical protein